VYRDQLLSCHEHSLLVPRLSSSHHFIPYRCRYRLYCGESCRYIGRGNVRLEKRKSYCDGGEDDRSPPGRSGVDVDMLEEGFDEGSGTPAIIESEGFEIADLLRNGCEIAGRDLIYVKRARYGLRGRELGRFGGRRRSKAETSCREPWRKISCTVRLPCCPMRL